MQRIPLSLADWLRDLKDRRVLSSEEQALADVFLRGELASGDAIRELVDRLIRRGRFVLVSRDSDDRAWVLRDPKLRARIRLHLPEAEPGLEHLGLVDDSGDKSPWPEWIDVETNLMAYDRVKSPRELSTRLQQIIEESVPGARAQFYALEMPMRESWPAVPWADFTIARDTIERVARDRNHLLRLRQRTPGRSTIIAGLGDAATGWCGFVVVDHGSPDALGPAAALLVQRAAQHFGGLITTVLRLEGLIFYDFLTGIYNRSYFEEQIEREIRLARRRQQSMALLIADVDDFKAFNTRFGYDGGDRVLATVACVLKSALRGTDTLARYGGEEFAIILAPPVPREEAHAIADRLRLAVAEEPFQLEDLDGNSVRQSLTVSIGGALFPDDGATPRELWGRANRLVLEAKEEGKNRVRFGEPPRPVIEPARDDRSS